MALLLHRAFEFVAPNDAVVAVGVVAGEPTTGAPVERARAVDAQALSHLRHVQPLFAAPLFAQVGDELGVDDSGQAYHMLMLGASEPVPEIRFVDHVVSAAARLVDNRRERHVAHPVANGLITDTQQLAHRS